MFIIFIPIFTLPIFFAQTQNFTRPLTYFYKKKKEININHCSRTTTNTCLLTTINRTNYSQTTDKDLRTICNVRTSKRARRAQPNAPTRQHDSIQTDCLRACQSSQSQAVSTWLRTRRKAIDNVQDMHAAPRGHSDNNSTRW